MQIFKCVTCFVIKHGLINKFHMICICLYGFWIDLEGVDNVKWNIAYYGYTINLVIVRVQ